jgi:hypothetical protein
MRTLLSGVLGSRGGTMTANRKLVSVSLAVVVCAVLGFAYGRIRTRTTIVYGGFEPYTINQKVEKVYDDGRTVTEELITVYTASDGSMREVRARLKQNSDQFDGTPIEQLIRPGKGSFFVYHTARQMVQFADAPPVVHLTAEDLIAQPGFDRSEALLSSRTAFVRRTVDDGGTAEVWRAPEFGLAVVGYRFRPKDGAYTLVRSTQSIAKGSDTNAWVDYPSYEQIKQPLQ